MHYPGISGVYVMITISGVLGIASSGGQPSTATMNYGFTADELTTYLQSPNSMSASARDAFKKRGDAAYSVAKQNADEAVRAADDVKKGTQAGTAQRAAAEASLDAAKDAKSALGKMGVTKFLES